MYHIQYLCPRTDIAMGRCGFAIALFPAWKNAVAASGLTQDDIDQLIKNCHRAWLDGCGYNGMIDPDEDPRARWEHEKLGKEQTFGPNAYHLYWEHDIRVAWGEWGPEHIIVPGNACGLDLDNGLGRPKGGKMLQPHNIDSYGQVILLLTVFTSIADHLVDFGYDKKG